MEALQRIKFRLFKLSTYRERTVVQLAELLHRYTEDLKELTQLRADAYAANDKQEAERYTGMIDVAQLTFIELHNLMHLRKVDH